MPVTTETPTPDPMAQIADVLRLMMEKQGGGLTTEMVEAIATASAKAAANSGAESMRRIMHPQNAQHPGLSVFSFPEGDQVHPKPVLRPRPDGQPGEVLFCNSRLDTDSLTPTTIDLFNRFTRTLTARNGRWRADLAPDGIGLHVTVPCKTIDDRMDLPSLDMILLELLDGQAAVDPISLADRVVELERQLAARA